MVAGGAILALDTATSGAVVGIGDAAGRVRCEVTWAAGHRHGEELLARIVAALADVGLRRDELSGIVAGTGPGAFTGLRIGLATAKTIAHELGVPIVGVSTALALAQAAIARGARPPVAVLLPVGPSGMVVVELEHVGAEGTLNAASPRLVSGSDPGLAPGVTRLAVDLDGRVDLAAERLGRIARAGLAASLIALGAARLARGERDDVARLVPEYASLPRGVAAASGTVSWSLDRR